MLDAGTGGGRVPIVVQNTGCYAFAIDIHRNLHQVGQRVSNDAAVNFVQADLLNLPFQDDFFDLAWSSCVIHHTPSTERAFRSIAKKVKPGGRFFVSGYSTDLHHYRLFRRLLPFARYLPQGAIYVLSGLIAAPLFIAFNSILFYIRTLRKSDKPPYKLLGFSFENIDHKSFLSIPFNLFDRLHPKFRFEHTVAELKEWFETSGFQDLVVTESVGMSAVYGVKSAAPII